MIDDTRGSGRPPADGGEGDRSSSASGDRAGDVSRIDASHPGSSDERAPRTGALRAVDADLAPVIPLFGRSDTSRSDRVAETSHPSRRRPATDATGAEPAADPPAGRPRLRALRTDPVADETSAAEWTVPGADLSRGRAAGARRGAGAGRFGGGSLTRAGDRAASSGPGLDSDDADTGTDLEAAAERAEALLLRKLRSRSLSLSEARTVIRGVEGVDETVVEDLIARFVDLGYLDDAAFAEQLAMSAVERRGDGRRAVAETLRKRGIPREIVDATLDELPDDDAERALDFARSKVRGVEGKDYEASLRRLAGQLARRGYPSSVALTAARTALSEAGLGRSRPFSRPASGVRFTPDD
ncbi:regulatory protein [Microbacterium hydrothermale]|uniref:regulatory protein RecX n=1 Tax=Microbacterium hydrothermale TaxID=857427 RepID=UPI0022279A17|nr:regulatory protein RecX [Microbacterium hydrothermale]MCW2164099.1 regulatory protein [Microbacterium hydrothermale]